MRREGSFGCHIPRSSFAKSDVGHILAARPVTSGSRPWLLPGSAIPPNCHAGDRVNWMSQVAGNAPGKQRPTKGGNDGREDPHRADRRAEGPDPRSHRPRGLRDRVDGRGARGPRVAENEESFLSLIFLKHQARAGRPWRSPRARFVVPYTRHQWRTFPRRVCRSRPDGVLA